MGESYGRFKIGSDSSLMPFITSANIACGMHAGDPTVMAQTVTNAICHETSIGAHPGFNDIWGFGRRAMNMAVRDIEYLVTYQIGALQALAQSQGASVHHVKPHGALNNVAHDDIEVARAIGRGIKAADRDLIFFANCKSAMAKAGEELGLRVAKEAYADRRYDDNGKMLSRDSADAVITDPKFAAAHVLRILEEGAIFSVNGKRIPTDVDTFCLHGDEPTAVELAKEIHSVLNINNFDILPITDIIQ
ncbi:5-oxoprolinase subunit PxpA [Sneathiella sp. DP05]|uniref:5-oxoprolinase subunit PxpA n=2 Tax=Sneathiella litorea TaxID=2606216 RepID=A0A6L8W8R4_9PROT|nr:5-oxoprolinase subunit PxpA [Sneathiella litorea]